MNERNFVQQIVDKYTDQPIDLLSLLTEGYVLDGRHITGQDAVDCLSEIMYAFAILEKDKKL